MNKIVKSFLKKLIPQSLVKVLKTDYELLLQSDVDAIKQNHANPKFSNILDKVSRKISVYDEMYKEKNGVHYLQVGLSALQCIETAIQQSTPKNFEQILDLPCGHGRVLRFLAEYFPNAELTACDTDAGGVDFCKKVFNASPVYSQPNLKEFNIGRKFDLIWCGSLATHFSQEKVTDLLKFFYHHLNIGGMLIFSMHGKFMLERLKTKQETYGLSEESIQKIVYEIETRGYGYADYIGEEYGVSCANSKHMQLILKEAGMWRDAHLYETAWDNHHDIYSVVKQQ